MDHLEEIQRRVSLIEEDLVSFLQEVIAIPSPSTQEKEMVLRVKEEMEGLGYQEIQIDPMGNILGRMGEGERVLAFDAHLDTVIPSDREAFAWDPYQGKIEDGKVFGLGAVDQKGGLASMLYAGKIMADLHLLDDYSIYMVGSIQEEDCDGLCWRYIIEEDGLNPEAVIITEPTNLTITRGQRGRMEMELVAKGRSCHGSAPERGMNAIYEMLPVIEGIKDLHHHLKEDDFLGKGSIAVTDISSSAPSLCAIPDQCRIHLDRRLIPNETKEEALLQIQEILKGLPVEAQVNLLRYSKKSYQGLDYSQEMYFPSWVTPISHPLVQGARKGYKALLGQEPLVGAWTFSTNAVSIAGEYGIPVIGFGPGKEELAHTAKEEVLIKDLLRATAFYVALLPYYQKAWEEKVYG